MEYVNIIVIDGKEIDFKDMDEKQRMEIADELNRKALNHLGYKEVQTA